MSFFFCYMDMWWYLLTYRLSMNFLWFLFWLVFLFVKSIARAARSSRFPRIHLPYHHGFREMFRSTDPPVLRGDLSWEVTDTRNVSVIEIKLSKVDVGPAGGHGCLWRVADSLVMLGWVVRGSFTLYFFENDKNRLFSGNPGCHPRICIKKNSPEPSQSCYWNRLSPAESSMSSRLFWARRNWTAATRATNPPWTSHWWRNSTLRPGQWMAKRPLNGLALGFGCW